VSSPPGLGDWVVGAPQKAHRRSSRRALAAGALALAAGALAVWAGVWLYGATAALPGETRTTGTVTEASGAAATGGDATQDRVVVAFYDAAGTSHEAASWVVGPLGGLAVGSRIDVAYGWSGPDGARVLAYADDPSRAGVGLGLALLGSALLLTGVAGVALGAGGWGPFGPSS
jgi:hypothetical protein